MKFGCQTNVGLLARSLSSQSRNFSKSKVLVNNYHSLVVVNKIFGVTRCFGFVQKEKVNVHTDSKVGCQTYGGVLPNFGPSLSYNFPKSRVLVNNY